MKMMTRERIRRQDKLQVCLTARSATAVQFIGRCVIDTGQRRTRVQVFARVLNSCEMHPFFVIFCHRLF